MHSRFDAEMKMKIGIFAIVLCTGMNALAADCEMKTILAENTEISRSVYTKVKASIQANPKLKNDLALSELREPEANVSLMYVADINNDGKNEYVFTSPGSGSGGYINVFVFAKVGDQFQYVGKPPKPSGIGDGPWYFYWYRNPQTNQIQFLVNGCGSSYMQFSSGPEKKLERYRWKNGKTERVL